MVEIDQDLKELKKLYEITGGREYFQIWYRAAGLGESQEGPDEIAMHLTENPDMDSQFQRENIRSTDEIILDFFDTLENVDVKGHRLMLNGELTGFGEQWKNRTDRGMFNMMSAIIDYEEDGKDEGVIYPDDLRSIGELYGALGRGRNLETIALIDSGENQKHNLYEVSAEEMVHSIEDLNLNGLLEQDPMELSEKGQKLYNAVVNGPDGDYEWIKKI